MTGAMEIGGKATGGKAMRKLAESGWVAAPSAAAALSEAGLPLPDVGYLAEAFDKTVWKAAEDAARGLAERFRTARFFDATEFEPLLVPDPSRFDVRVPAPEGVRADQPEVLKPDFLDERIGEGVNACDEADAWTLFVAATSPAGLAMGSYDDVAGAPSEAFTVEGFDTRSLMIRQLWGALTFQCGREMPDSERREAWTFTVFAGEAPVSGSVVSGTVLHGQVRQRLGKPTRGISSARVRPALRIAGASG